MPQTEAIQYFHRYNNRLETENIYGDALVRWLYQTKSGKCLSAVLCRGFVSQLYGAIQNTGWSRKKIDAFVRDYEIDMDAYLPEEGGTSESPYSSFNQFFIRRFKAGKRPFKPEANLLPAFAEGRYLGYEVIGPDQAIDVKGSELRLKTLLNNQKWFQVFNGGPLLICRLCPVDYHRFHFPDDGAIVDTYRIPGPYHSVNPIALKNRKHILDTNERVVSILETEHFGKLAHIEVGAICVGKIVQTHDSTLPFQRGDEKGCFLFGGSTVIVIGEKGQWIPEDDILNHSETGMETYIKLGDVVGKRLEPTHSG
ncbi:MAG: phosphatidylserine decarboxylase [Deltaproteobacteria bacterium]|nr:phosphatidylserine decarboxylase [Deltaproteobacteria bacterium]